MNHKPVLIPIIFIILILSFFIFQGSEENITGFVTERTISSKEDMLFEYDIIKYPSSAQVIPPTVKNGSIQIGLDIDPTGLNFGIIPGNGSYSKRFINLTNQKDKDVKISIETYGSITPYINFSRNNFILRGNEKVVIKAYFYTDEAAAGNYTGEMDVIIQKPKYDFIYLFWGS